MKKFLLFLVCLFSFSLVTFAENDKAINFKQLPVKAQKFIQTNFKTPEVQKVFKDESDSDYEVRLKGGLKIEFDRNGRWTEIESKKRPIPAKLVPSRIRKQVKEKYGAAVKVLEISREDDEIEVKLSNGKELEFERNKKQVEEED